MFTYFFTPFWKFTASDWFGWVFVFWRQELGWSVVFFGGCFFCWVLMAHNFLQDPGKSGKTWRNKLLIISMNFTPQNPACPKRLKRWYGFRCFPVTEPNLQGSRIKEWILMGSISSSFDQNREEHGGIDFTLGLSFFFRGWRISIEDEVLRLRLKLKLKSFFCASPLKLDSYRPFFLFGSSSLPGWRRHSMACAAHSTHHFRPRRAGQILVGSPSRPSIFHVLFGREMF